MRRARLSPWSPLTLVAALALAGCGGTGTATQPVDPLETDEVPIVTPVATVAGDPTAPPDSNGGPADNGNGWPVTVTVTISGTNDSDGSYGATALARGCGNPFASIDPTAPAFTFEFPLDGEHNPRDIAFSAEDLRPGASTTLLHVGVSIVNAEGREPAATVVDSALLDSRDTGQASLTEADGKRTLVVNATNSFGESIQLTAVCGPAPG